MGISISILKLFPIHIASEIKSLVTENDLLPEELRIKVGQPPIIRSFNKEFSCSEMITSRDLRHIMLNATNGALHMAIHKMQNGYLPLPEGSRLGLCGEGSVLNGTIHNLKNITSICIRIANPIKGCADNLILNISNSSIKNTIIIAPPGFGKTTLLREMIRQYSEMGFYIGVADEREEISGMHCGLPAFELGPRTDVITGIPKHLAAQMLIRSMSPQVLAMDEITSTNDLPVIGEAFGCGVSLITTIHGNNPSDLLKPAIRPILDLRVFEYAVSISIKNNERKYTLEKLYD